MGVAKNDKTKSHWSNFVSPRPTIVGLTAPEINYLFQEMLKDTPLVVPALVFGQKIDPLPRTLDFYFWTCYIFLGFYFL